MTMEEIDTGPCYWKEDMDGVWSSSCGESWFFDCGDPKENGMRFCPFCGAGLVQVKWIDRTDEEDEHD